MVDTRVAPGSHRQHGTHARYVLGPNEAGQTGKGCRCEPCRQANTAYERERKRRAEPAYVAAGPARQHIQWLSTQGVGLKRVAQISGVSHGALWKLVYGKNGRPSKRIRPQTAQRILAVTPSAGAGGSRVPAGPTWEIVNRLLARGWTKAAIAQAIGQTGPGLQISDKVVTRRNANAIRALLDQPVPPRRSRWGLHPVPDVDEPEQADDTPQPDPLLQLADILEARIDENPWRRRAACIDKPRWLFFPARGDRETTARAKAVCATCPVRGECRDANLHQTTGIWGGTSELERRAMRRRTA